MSGENIKKAFSLTEKNGHHIGAFALYGYKKDPSKRAFDYWWRSCGSCQRSFYTVFTGIWKNPPLPVCWMTEEWKPYGIQTTSWLRWQPLNEKQYPMEIFCHIRYVVNEIYIGNMVQGKCDVSYKTKQNPDLKTSGTELRVHEPIDGRLWDRVQALVSKRQNLSTVGTIGLFARKARCMNLILPQFIQLWPFSPSLPQLLLCAVPRYIFTE